MWKKQLRSRQSLQYRKRYKCPNCEKYTLYAIHDFTYECKNGCDTENMITNDIIRVSDFNGYYTSQELEESFYVDDESINALLKECTIDNTLHLVKEKEKDELNVFFKRSDYIDKLLDDVVVNYMRVNNIYEINKVTSFGYLINVIEDMHHFANLCVKDLILFNYGVEFAKYHFYSGRFFYNNAIENLFLVSERSFVLLGLIYDFDFKQNLEENKTYLIERFIKKHPEYKKSDYKKIFEKLKGNNLFRELNEIRKSNDHDLSFYSRMIKEDIESNGSKNNDKWNRDANEVDKEIYLPKIKNMIFCLNQYYEFLETLVTSLDEEHYNISEAPMLKYFLNSYQHVPVRQYDNTELELLDARKDSLFSQLPIDNNMILSDVFFRVAEIVHCITDIYNLANDSFYKTWRCVANIELKQLINEEYLLYSSLFRTYACYDKISRMIAYSINQETKVKYFSDFANVNCDNPLSNLAKKTALSDNYIILHRIRNDIYHNLRLGSLYGEQGNENMKVMIFAIIFENVKQIINILELLLTYKNRKVGRNELCLCGSGKKYKKCCIA